MEGMTINQGIEKKNIDLFEKMIISLKDIREWLKEKISAEKDEDKEKWDKFMAFYKNRMKEFEENPEEPCYKDEDELIHFIKEVRRENYEKAQKEKSFA